MTVWLYRIRAAIKHFKCRALFGFLRLYCKGTVLDVGGGDFYQTVSKRQVRFDQWITVDIDAEARPKLHDPKFGFVVADGSALPFASGSFDTVSCIHVLEHVFQPYPMFTELVRVLKRGGCGIVLVPQTIPLHHIPNHFQNLTLFWLRQACKDARVEVLAQEFVGGFWTTIASRMVYFFLQSARLDGYSSSEFKRSALFYLLFPIMATWAVANILISLLFAAGDLTEEASDHLVVFTKP